MERISFARVVSFYTYIVPRVCGNEEAREYIATRAVSNIVINEGGRDGEANVYLKASNGGVRSYNIAEKFMILRDDDEVRKLCFIIARFKEYAWCILYRYRQEMFKVAGIVTHALTHAQS